MKQKLMKLKDGLRGNQGFTLIELLTSLMIFAFFAVALLQYMITASSIHSTVNSNVNLEVKALATLGTIEEYAIDASASVIFDKNVTGEKTLYILNNESYDGTSSGCTVYAFRYIESSGELQYMTTKSTDTVNKTTTTVNNTYHQRKKVESGTTVEETYKKVVTTTYNTSVSAPSDPYNTTTVVEKYASLAEAKDEDEVGEYVGDSVPILDDGWVEVKSYESYSTVDFTHFTLFDGSKEVLTTEMTNFDANLIMEEGKILQVDLTFGLANQKDSYEKVASIMLRNTPPNGKIATS